MASWDTVGFETIMPITKTLGITFESTAADHVRARMDFNERLCTAGGVLHGGAIMALADSTGAACAFLNLPEDATGTTTIESKTNFLRAVRSGHLDSNSTPLHVGRTVIVVETDVRDEEGNLIARVTQSQLVLRER